MQVDCQIFLSTSLMQVVTTTCYHKLDASCYNKFFYPQAWCKLLQQLICKYQVASSLIFNILDNKGGGVRPLKSPPPRVIHTSSVIMRSISTLAWMKSKSVLRLTVPLIPIRQCSFVCWNIAFGSRNFTFPGFFLFVLIQQISSQRRNPHLRRHWREMNVE